ncbi:hypothetical protein M441DRAFT_326873 [Trichoderma asperellum CBS 433.97]|uniref:Uncharacterized protein n=1 Tax=Trichoderma asperellum (strain ATCC 204424 / CBS 433.97 / NBRC 101777) TaxID=1042311 RepID=A0A2T3ZM32_TRIA4|nr:hypothetical protein M441DRAFT_326873 [Trichoderma asperellum CBS 433.97]PTB45865.1 hypothetical protein M441DRAFT_326873 [Trichoderma asperellum CBS 433.97]
MPYTPPPSSHHHHHHHHHRHHHKSSPSTSFLYGRAHKKSHKKKRNMTCPLFLTQDSCHVPKHKILCPKQATILWKIRLL